MSRIGIVFPLILFLIRLLVSTRLLLRRLCIFGIVFGASHISLTSVCALFATQF